MNKKTRKSLDFYLAQKYPFTIYPDEVNGYVAEFVDLPGCLTQAETIDELMSSLEEAKRGWITAAYEMGQDIPLPVSSDDFKGKILLRVSRSLHQDLARSAEMQGVSLNQYASNLLAAGVHGDLVKQQAFELFDEVIPRVIKASHSKSAVLGNIHLKEGYTVSDQ
jgi:predicted RNase H-like HicB family nuclease